MKKLNYKDLKNEQQINALVFGNKITIEVNSCLFVSAKKSEQFFYDGQEMTNIWYKGIFNNKKCFVNFEGKDPQLIYYEDAEFVFIKQENTDDFLIDSFFSENRWFKIKNAKYNQVIFTVFDKEKSILKLCSNMIAVSQITKISKDTLASTFSRKKLKQFENQQYKIVKTTLIKSLKN